MKWIYHKYMGRNNPVCNDIGDIEEVLSSKGSQYVSSLYNGVKVKGVYYGGDTKPLFVRFGGFFPAKPFIPNNEEEVEFRRLPDGIKDGDELEVRPRLVWLWKDNESLQPVCTDPRVLYMAFKGWEICPSPSAEEVEKWKNDIPTIEFAVKWLKERGLYCACTPMDEIMRNIQRADYDAEMHRLMPRAF